MKKKYIVGIDVGGTFTDAIIYNEEDSSLHRTKVLTTADDQSIGTLAAFKELFNDLKIDEGQLRRFNHGYTVGINAALTRTGAKTALLCTSGHREKLDSGGMARPFHEGILYNPSWQRPHQANPIVPRRYRRDIPERLSENGTELLPLDEEAVRREVEFLRSEGVESIAICFINSYIDQRNEERTRQIVEEIMPSAYVQTSKIYPVAGEAKRTWVVVLDAYCGPKINTYVQKLKYRMKSEMGYDDEIYVMQMGGGLATSDAIMNSPINTLQSGPVSGMLGSEFYAMHLLESKNLVCVDVGGTSTDIGLIRDGKVEITRNWELDYSIPYAIPSVDVRSIGAGGGSLIIVDEMGSLRVGPESAGSKPGPACYGLGGTSPAVTDACVAMGLIQPELFLGGRMSLNKDLAINALKSVGDKIKMNPITLAQGAYEFVTLNIAKAVEKTMVSKGLHPANYSLMGFGAAGPVFAVSAARELGIKETVIPYFPGGFASFGMLTSRLKTEHSVSPMVDLESFGPDQLNQILGEVEEACISDLVNQGVAREAIILERTLCGMYHGQSWDQRIPVPVEKYDAENFRKIRKYFDDHYDAVFGYKAEELKVFLTTVSAIAYGPYPDINLPEIRKGSDTPDTSAVEMVRKIYLDRKSYDKVPFYDRFKLLAGNKVKGPAVIDDKLSTIVINDGTTAHVDIYGNIVVKL